MLEQGRDFHGIPIKIYNNTLNITLLDSLNKRVRFLNTVIDELNLQKIVAVHDRIETYSKINKEKFH